MKKIIFVIPMLVCLDTFSVKEEKKEKKERNLGQCIKFCNEFKQHDPSIKNKCDSILATKTEIKLEDGHCKFCDSEKNCKTEDQLREEINPKQSVK